MEDVVQELVSVRATAGVPTLVCWRGLDYRVVGRPVRWVDRAFWWTWPADQDPQIVEQPMWSVSLAEPGGGILQADLSVSPDDWWRLERVRG